MTTIRRKSKGAKRPRVAKAFNHNVALTLHFRRVSLEDWIADLSGAIATV
jgi:hypothetical protein